MWLTIKNTMMNILGKFVAAIFTEAFIMKVIFKVLDHVAAKTTTQIDDKIVAELKEIYYGKVADKVKATEKVK